MTDEPRTPDEPQPPTERPDPRTRPPDPAGTQPRFDPESLLPATPAPSVRNAAHAPAIDVEGVEVSPDDDDVREGDLLPEPRRADAAPALATAPADAPPHAAKLQFALGALIAVGIAGIALLIAVIARPADNAVRGPTWSTWSPSTAGVTGANQIALHVGQEYRFSDGRQLVGVQASKMEFDGVPLDVAVRQAPADGGNIQIFSDGGVIYRFCGFGTNCSISSGKPSNERHLLLRREALELALYSLRYLGGVKSVVVFMPPPPGKRPSQALFFRQGDVSPELTRPLTATLTPKVPSVRTVTVSPDAQLVNAITMPKLFKYSLTAANTANRGFIVLDPPTATAPATPPPVVSPKTTKKK